MLIPWHRKYKTLLSHLIKIMNRSLLNHRIIFIDQEIEPTIASSVVSDLLELNAVDQKKPIEIYINSPGGNVPDGFAIIDVMQMMQSIIRTICVGKAYSMAAWILAAGTKGHRFITEHSEVMIHQTRGTLSGNTDQIVLYSERMKQQEIDMNRMLSDWTGKNIDKIEQDTKMDFYMNAKEALDYGLVDQILKNSP